ncbi:Ubiquitin carboxyl-terminal hydrolase 10 [Blastocladiella emersonii ATCC 22665]|nr:Ubiquitin carboxyl-terminal hydrolase 10 [Blastocladiella emersonii ATCC 22665]
MKKIRLDDGAHGAAAATSGNGSGSPAREGSRRDAHESREPGSADIGDDEEDDGALGLRRKLAKRTGDASSSVVARDNDLYLDTIDRAALDFDFEKVCSVSLTNVNVYACLVCGKYFQGRGKSSHAYTHSVHDDHHVFVNMHTLRFYILPDGYEVQNATLADVKYAIHPTYSREQVAALDANAGTSLDLAFKQYMPGFVGLNNIKANDYVNVVLQALARVRPLRDFFLLHPDLAGQSELVQRFGLLMRKLWSTRAFKGQVSPHEFLQEVNTASGRQFKITEQGDPMPLLSWLLNALHANLSAKRSPVRTSLVFDTLRGSVAVRTQTVVATTEDERQQNELKRQLGVSEASQFDDARDVKDQEMPYLMLGLELPPPPLFQDEQERNIIPQVSLAELLDKYNGQTVRQYGDTVKMYRIKTLPQYLILNIKRFVKNNWTVEKNPTIVNFSPRCLNMAPYVGRPEGETRYTMVANIVHEGKAESGQGAYKVHVRHRALGQWYAIQDLLVEEVMPHMVALGETYLQIWERVDVAGTE